MSQWTADVLARIAAAQEVRIAAERGASGWAPIWVVRVGDDLYVRSWRGTDGAWYRHATEQARARVRAGNLEQQVIVSRIDDTEAATQSAIDETYRAKYSGSAYLEPMLGPKARAATLRLRPHH